MAKIKLQDVKNAIDVGKEVLPIVDPIIREHAPEVVERAVQKARQAGRVAAGARDGVFGKIQQRKESKDQKKAMEEARKNAVSKSLPPVSAQDFFVSFEAGVSAPDDLRDGYMAISGCYAILTMKSNRDKDLSAYEDVYVGCSDTVGFAVYLQLCGFGNVDVYADFKYKQSMKVLFYPCEKDQMGESCAALKYDLQSDESYNGRELEMGFSEIERQALK